MGDSGPITDIGPPCQALAELGASAVAVLAAKTVRTFGFPAAELAWNGVGVPDSEPEGCGPWRRAAHGVKLRPKVAYPVGHWRCRAGPNGFHRLGNPVRCNRAAAVKV